MQQEPATIPAPTVQTNIVIFKVRGVSDVAPTLAALKRRGVLAGAAASDQIRFVTHHDVDHSACARAAQVVAELVTGAAEASASVDDRACNRVH